MDHPPEEFQEVDNRRARRLKARKRRKGKLSPQPPPWALGAWQQHNYQQIYVRNIVGKSR